MVLFRILALLAGALVLCKALLLYRLAASEARCPPNGADLTVGTDTGEIIAASVEPAAGGPVLPGKSNDYRRTHV